MLKARIITGVLYIGIMLCVILFMPEKPFMIVMGILSCLMLFEWMRLIKLAATWERLLALMIFVFLISVCYWWDAARIFSIYVAVMFWLVLLIVLLARQMNGFTINLAPSLGAVLALVILVPTYSAVVHLRDQPQGQFMVLMLFVLLWASDSLAYISGKLFGRHKLASHISPGKTWEGLAGSVLLTVPILCFYQYFMLEGSALSSKAIFAYIVLVLAAAMGDLFESYIKRVHRVKDSGNILPGHGGLLDRLDSLLAAAPFFAVFQLQGVF